MIHHKPISECIDGLMDLAPRHTIEFLSPEAVWIEKVINPTILPLLLSVLK